MNEILAVAVDLDDTLLRNDKSISARTLAAWEDCCARGIRLIVATARSEHAAERFLRQLRPDAVVSNAGATARVGERTVCNHILAPETVCGIAQACMKLRDVVVTAETEAGYYWSKPEKPESSEYGPAFYTDFTHPIPPTYKMTVEIPEREAAFKIAASFPDSKLTAYAGESWYRFSPQGVHKMTGLRAVLDELGIAPEQTAAFGDDYSDIEMLGSVGWGVAMGNAIAEVKAAACCITADNTHDGVARWLENRILAPITVRRAVLDEAEQLFHIQRKAFLPMLVKYGDYGVNPASETPEVFRIKMTREQTTPYVILRGGKPVGYVRVIRLAEDTCKISALSVLPEYHSRGIAQEALKQIEALYPETKVWTLDTVAQEAGNRHLYEKLGYLQVGEEHRVNVRMSLIDYRKKTE